MENIKLSYLISTRNKLSYLKLAIEPLLGLREADEEIVVVDGGSTDGSKEYLLDLFNQGKIQQLISEQDSGESHGYNKAIMLAKGELLKIITDDDVYFYPAIKRCKKFMLSHPQVDIIQAHIGETSTASGQEIFLMAGYKQGFLQWEKDRLSYGTCGISLMLRRCQIPLFGLFNTHCFMVDNEFSYRVTSLPGVSIAFYECPIAVHLTNPTSNLLNIKERYWIEETVRTAFFYNVPLSWKMWISYFSRRGILAGAKRIYRSLKNSLKIFKFGHYETNNHRNFNIEPVNLREKFSKCEKWLEEQNRLQPHEFLVP